MKLTLDKIGEVLKNFGGVLSSLLALLQLKVRILPINAAIAEELWPVAIILAAVAGFGAHQTAKRSGRLTLAYFAFGLTAVAFFFILWLVNDPPFEPKTISTLARVMFVSFYLFLGAAIGGLFR